MITELEISGFKTLRNVKVPLAPGITVIVGANNSGKTNILSALKLLREIAVQGRLDGALITLGGMDSVLARGMNRISIAISANNESRAVRYEFGDKSTVGKHESSLFLAELSNIRVLDFSVPALRAAAKLEANAELGPDGLNLAAVLDVLANTRPAVFERIVREVGAPVTDVKRILTPPGPVPGTKVVGVEEIDGGVYRSSQMSDGLLLFIAMSVAAQLSGMTPSLIAIEEPDRGIHPRRIREVVDQFRRIAAQGTQVVLTTHSPILLDEFRDSPESILLVDRDKEGTHVQRLSDHPAWKEELVRDKPLGEIWYSGILGGTPR